MTTIYDSHLHLDRCNKKKLPYIVSRAKKAGVRYMMNAGIETSDIDSVVEICKNYSDDRLEIFCSVANHPERVNKVGIILSSELMKTVNSSNFVKAIGETGIDTHRPEYDNDVIRRQFESFEIHVDVATTMKLPLIVHAYGKNSVQKTIDFLNSRRNKDLSFVMHCYDGTYEQAKRIIDNNGIISVSGTITYKKNSHVRDAIRKIPLDRLTIETDSPYLSPYPALRRANEPSYIVHTANFISELLDIKYDDLCYITTQNALRFYKQVA